jgi:hypothetical protein
MASNPAPARSDRSDNRESIYISQADNYAGKFGEVVRSSAIFWARHDAQVKTTISISNYWKYKNSIDACVLVNLRDLSGRLLDRARISFAESEVCNYCPPRDFHGSIEVEAFSARNLRIPYAAVMAIYECADSISMVHSYARAYSQHEIEDKRTICIGEESCWTVRETPAVTSFCAIHNGAGRTPDQRVRLGIRRTRGAERVTHFELPGLAPFQTVVIEPRLHFPDLVDWLQGEAGNARISFRLEGAFTRMLCGVHTVDWTQLQTTHSNFDYSIHQTDTLTQPDAAAYMLTPTIRVPGVRQEVVVYPDSCPGNYTMSGDGFQVRFHTTQTVEQTFADNEGVRLEFRREDGLLPTRIITGLRLKPGGAVVPAECSTGVAHGRRPPKHFSWMVVSPGFDSAVCWVAFSDIYGACPADAKMVFKLYAPGAREAVTREMTYGQLPSGGWLRLKELFDGLESWSEAYGYLSVWSSYGGLEFSSTLRKKDSICIEHSF